MDIKTIHEQCDRFMSGPPVPSRSGSERLPQLQSSEFPEAFVTDLAAKINLNDLANHEFIREFTDGRAAGSYRDVHVLEYVRSRRIDENLDSLTFGGASV